jgi:A/G-specific adenine glycosylase
VTGRDLSVRTATDPWQVLVIEVMSQQTRIDRVEAAWRPFVTRWPTPTALATAEMRELLSAWAGLGYNRRALALRQAAREIVERHGGEAPSSLASLEALPGVGPYTARAVMAVAFGQPVAPLDVNVRRVVGRLVGGPLPPGRLQETADSLVSRVDSRGWVWAVMDLAVTACTRRAPRCAACPLRALCASAGTAGAWADTASEVDRAAARSRPTRPRFPETNRWLRGEILRRLRATPDGAWTTLPGRIGSHEADAVGRALDALVAEGFAVRSGDLARLA